MRAQTLSAPPPLAGGGLEEGSLHRAKNWAIRMSECPLRPPSQVMRLGRMGAMHATRLSFLRAMLRRAKREQWKINRAEWAIDTDGFGHAVYAVRTPRHTYSLLAFSHDLPAENRTDRVIAEAWDASFCLYDGVPDEAEIARLRANVPRQEAGRYTERDLVLSRANKSVRLFEPSSRSLAAGQQPDAGLVESVGYLMRTTAVYGNGKFGIADRDEIVDRPEFAGPFQAEMLTVWLIRAFTVDLVEHRGARDGAGDGGEARAGAAAAVRRRQRHGARHGAVSGTPPAAAAPLDGLRAKRRSPAFVRCLRRAPKRRAVLLGHADAAAAELQGWHTADPVQMPRDSRAAFGPCAMAGACGALDDRTPLPWDALYRWTAANLAVEGAGIAVVAAAGAARRAGRRPLRRDGRGRAGEPSPSTAA